MRSRVHHSPRTGHIANFVAIDWRALPSRVSRSWLEYKHQLQLLLRLLGHQTLHGLSAGIFHIIIDRGSVLWLRSQSHRLGPSFCFFKLAFSWSSKATQRSIFQVLGLHGAFWFYAAMAVCGLCFVVCCVPETKGKQLDEMNPDYAQAR